jgi:hypothetical protein
MDAFPVRHLEVLVCVVKGKCRFSNLVLIKLDLDSVEATVEIQAAISIDFKAFTYLNDSFRVHLRSPHVSHKGLTEMAADPQV